MKIFKFYIMAILLFASINAYAQVAVIANKSVADASITSSKLENIYSLRDKVWSDGKGITLFTLKSESSTVEKFFSSFGKSSSDMKKLWMKLQLTGEGIAPEALGSEEEVVNKVSTTPGAIGFVSADKAKDNVKIILTIK